MITCKEVATLLSTGQYAEASLARRLGVRLHLAMCRHCRAFSAQLVRLAEAARSARRLFEREVPADFESRLTHRLKLWRQNDAL